MYIYIVQRTKPGGGASRRRWRMFTTAGVCGAGGRARARARLSHRMNQLIGVRKSTPKQYFQLIIYDC